MRGALRDSQTRLCTGSIWDSQTGLYKMGARYYDPGGGRFTQVDPQACSSAANLYWYADSDPANVTDPTGYGPGCGGLACPTPRAHGTKGHWTNCDVCNAVVGIIITGGGVPNCLRLCAWFAVKAGPESFIPCLATCAVLGYFGIQVTNYFICHTILHYCK